MNNTTIADSTLRKASAIHTNPEKPRLRARTGSTRVGFLGAGYISEWHAKALANISSVKLVAVCDRDKNKANGLAAQFGAEAVFDSLETMLRDGNLDAIHVLLPPEAHFQATMQILAADVDVFLEKPMCTRPEECETLVQEATRRSRKLGVGHNFLFADIYERLRSDIKNGLLGRIDQMDVIWHKELPQARFGPFDAWMLRQPQNILYEIGPHLITPALDLIGLPDSFSVHPSNPIELPTKAMFYRRCQINAYKASTAIQLKCSFVPGYAEHNIHVRGSLGSATADFERNTYVLQRHTSYEDDFDRYAMTRADARTLAKQGWSNLKQYILSKAKLSKNGNAYGVSIRRSVEAFYNCSAPENMDSRISGEMGRDAIDLISRMGDQAALSLSPPLPAFQPSPYAPKILILGASGFIGQELVRQFIGRGDAVRLLVRSPGKLPADFHNELVDVARGDAGNANDLDKALDGIDYVYHLARPMVKTWEDYQSQDIEVTRLIAERSLAAKVKRFIYTGTIDSYYAGRRAGVITEQTPLDIKIHRRNYYARAKAVSEEFLLDMHRKRSLPLVIARPGVVIGRGGTPFHWGVGMWRHEAICQLWGNGENKLPFVLVEDVADGLIRMLDVPGIEGESFNLVADPCLTGREFLDALQHTSGLRLAVEPTAISKFYFADMFKWIIKVMVRHPSRRMPSYRDWESRTQMAVYNCSKAKQKLGWQPTNDPSELIRRGIDDPVQKELQ